MHYFIDYHVKRGETDVGLLKVSDLRESRLVVTDPSPIPADELQRTADWLNAAGAPVLVMHGKRDSVAPFKLGVMLFNELRVPKQFLSCDTAEHCEIESIEPQRYYDTIAKFVEEHR